MFGNNLVGLLVRCNSMPKEIQVGSRVRLFHGGTPGFGSLNSSYLWEQGYRGDWLTIQAEDGYGNAGKYWRVTLPSGVSLSIHRGDILEIN